MEHQSRTTILVVEDEGIVALDLQQNLIAQGYHVPSILNRGEDVEAVVNDIRPDLILMDINLQGEMTGIQAAQSITTTIDIPIIFLTAFADRQTVEQATFVNPYGYIVKPYDEVELFAAIEIALHKHDSKTQITIQKKWLETILQSIGDAVVVTDQTGTITFLNRTAETLTRWTQQEAMGKNIEEVIDCIAGEEGEKIENPLKQAIRQGRQVGIPLDTLLIDKNGLEIPIDDSATPILNDQGECIGAVIVFKDISERIEAEKALSHQAFHDFLTNLPNRALFLDRIENSIARCSRYAGDCFALLFIDLDRFKLVNDSCGHSVGDKLLIQATQRILSCLRPSDTLARLGGDEFAILLEKVTDEKVAAEVADRILQCLLSPFEIETHQLYISASIGIVLSNRDYHHSENIVRDADIAMYQAKASGKACYRFFDASMFTKVKGSLNLENDLRKALWNKELQVHFQPCISLKNNEIIGFEALVRWYHPQLGDISPSRFIPIAEESSLIIHLDSWVMREACMQLKLWQDKYPATRKMKMSVNLSSKQFLQPDILKSVKAILEEADLPAECLQIEITERVLIENFQIASNVLSKFKALGIGIHLDDFGTGYSSLGYLHQFPIDTLKIDRSFVQLLLNDDEKDEFVKTIVLLAHSLGMTAVAEGIEETEQFSKMKALNCEHGQGFLFYKPDSAQAIERILDLNLNPIFSLDGQ